MVDVDLFTYKRDARNFLSIDRLSDTNNFESQRNDNDSQEESHLHVQVHSIDENDEFMSFHQFYIIMIVYL